MAVEYTWTKGAILALAKIAAEMAAADATVEGCVKAADRARETASETLYTAERCCRDRLMGIGGPPPRAIVTYADVDAAWEEVGSRP